MIRTTSKLATESLSVLGLERGTFEMWAQCWNQKRGFVEDFFRKNNCVCVGQSAAPSTHIRRVTTSRPSCRTKNWSTSFCKPQRVSFSWWAVIGVVFYLSPSLCQIPSITRRATCLDRACLIFFIPRTYPKSRSSCPHLTSTLGKGSLTLKVSEKFQFWFF